MDGAVQGAVLVLGAGCSAACLVSVQGTTAGAQLAGFLSYQRGAEATTPPQPHNAPSPTPTTPPMQVLKLDVAPPKDTGGVRGIAAPTNLTMNQTLEGHHGACARG